MRLIGEKDFRGFSSFLRQVAVEGEGKTDPDFYEPVIDTRGVVHCVRVPISGLRRPKGAPGLVLAQKSANRTGLNGAAPSTRKQIDLAARNLNRFPNRCAFGAFTPSPADMDTIERSPGGSANFQRRLGDSLSYFLRRKGLPQLWLIVPEVSARRSDAWGRPAIHWHFLCLAKRFRNQKGWWISKSEWLDIYKRAFFWHSSTEAQDTRASTRCEVARNPARYLSKYLSKNETLIGDVSPQGHEEAIPRQWFSTSKPLREMKRRNEARLPAAFAQFLVEEFDFLSTLGLGFARHWTPPGCTSFEVMTFRIKDYSSLLLIWERFIAWDPRPWATTQGDVPRNGISVGVDDLSPSAHVDGACMSPLRDASVTQLRSAPVSQQLNVFDGEIEKSVIVPFRRMVIAVKGETADAYEF